MRTKHSVKGDMGHWTAACLGALLVASVSAQAQSWPSKPVRIFLPQPPGSGVDVILRRAFEDIQPRLGQPLVVENRPGGNSVVASEACAKAVPDGHTVCVLNTDPVVSNPLLFSKLPYDPDRDLRPITNLYYILSGVFVKSVVPANSMQELQALAKAKPGALNAGTFGVRSTLDMSRLYLSDRWGSEIVGIPYPGGPQVFNALAAGDIDIAALGAYGGLSLIKAGKVKLLAVSGSKRLALFPNVPTLAELGMGDLPSGQSWWGLFGPVAMPDAVAQRLNAEFVRVFRDVKFNAFLADLITEPNVGTPEEFAALIRTDRERVARFMKQHNWTKE
jgi:tripartite-type tricarboxylate transporter receptor subunit TctC